MRNQKGRDYSATIIWTSALIGMVRYAAAFLSSDLGEITGALSVIVTWMMGVSGFFMGILGTLGTAYIFDGWRQKMPKTNDKWNNKFIALTLFVAVAIFAEVIILVPFTMSRVLHLSVADVLNNGVWWWSTAVVVMPFVLIGGVSVSNQIVSVRSEQPSEPPSEPLANAANGSRTFASLDADDKRFIMNNSSKAAAVRLGVSVRAVQKWRVKVQEQENIKL